MSLRIRVDPQKQVILFGANLHHAVQVTRLEIRIEGQLLLFIESGVHAFECSVEHLVSVKLVMRHCFLN